MDYFYAQLDDIRERSLVLRGDESKHLARVLRKNIGETVFVSDGTGRMFETVIESFETITTRCRIVAVHRDFNEPTVNITLAVSPLKNPGRFDFLIEKATELGARQFIPILCERTISHRDKQERLQKIALAAMKQCGRSFLPSIMPQVAYHELLTTRKNYDLACIPHERMPLTKSLASVIKDRTLIKTILITIGPEGGFTETEVRDAEAAGFAPVSLGNSRLRSETAALAALCALHSTGV